MQNKQDKSNLDKSQYIKSLNESKISRRKPKQNESLISKDLSVSGVEFPNDPIDQSSIILDYKNNAEVDRSQTKLIENFDINRIVKNVGENDTNEDYNTGANEKNMIENEDLHLKEIISHKISENLITNLTLKIKKSDTNLKDISEISQNSNFIIRNSIQNSIFNHNDNFDMEKLEEEFGHNTENQSDFNGNINANIFLNDSILTKENDEKRLGEIFFQKILNAQHGEEIILPERTIQMKGLLITKPVKIIGQPNCVLEITEGPISINISENYENEVVKFSQVKILFNISETEQSIIKNFKGDHAKFTVLFRLYPGSLLEIEDCDVSCIKDNTIPVSKHKLICFQLMYCKYLAKNSSLSNKNIMVNTNNSIISPTILTIISSRIEKFYQTIRSAENCIINIEKSFINKNLGKPLCILNPLIIKVVGSTFEGNGDNAIHLKFVKDENLLYDNRKLFFKNNEFAYNFGTGVYVDGIENFIFDLDIIIESNIFKKNKGDAVFMLDLFVKSLVVKENKFLFGKANGLNLNKVYHKSTLSSQNTQPNSLSMSSYSNEHPLIEIKENEFIDNNGFGIFINDVKAGIYNNNFFQNIGSGILLINLNTQGGGNSNMINNINIDNKNPQTPVNISNLNENSHLNKDSISSTLSSATLGCCYLYKNSFVKNGSSGLRIINYNHFVYVSECYFKENVDYGIQIESDSSTSILNGINPKENLQKTNYLLTSDSIKLFKNSDNSKMPRETNLLLQNCTIVNNMKSGIYLNNCFIFLENTIISDNIDYAIYTMKEEYRYCYKQSKNSQKNMIQGNVGGPWGEISISNRTLCNGCTSATKIKKNKDPNRLTNPTPIFNQNNVVYSTNSNYMISSSGNSNQVGVTPPVSVSNKKANSDNSNNAAIKNFTNNVNDGKCIIN